MIRDMLRTRLADALAHTLATKPFELTPGEDLERQVNLAMADAVLVVVAEWFSEEAAEQWRRATNHDDPRSRELATIRAMYLTDRAIELEGGELTDRRLSDRRVAFLVKVYLRLNAGGRWINMPDPDGGHVCRPFVVSLAAGMTYDREHHATQDHERNEERR